MKGLTEHFNQTMSPYLAKMINNDQQNWDKVNNSDRISNIKTIIHQTLALFHALPTTDMDCMLVVVLFVLCISVHCWIFRVYMLWILRKESVLPKSQYLKVHKHYNGYHYRSRVGLLTSSSSKMVEDGEEIAEVIRQLIASWQKAECSEDPKGGMWPKVQHSEVKLIMVVWVLHPVRYLVLV